MYVNMAYGNIFHLHLYLKVRLTYRERNIFCEKFAACKTCLFVYVDALHTSEQFFSHIRMIASLTWLNQYLAEDIVSCSWTHHSAFGESRTHDPSISSLPLSHCTPHERLSTGSTQEDPSLYN